ncbi:MAG: hypothetical protein ACMUHU_00075 [Thermoplasmatota archaeon]
MKVRNMAANLSILERLFFTTIRLSGLDENDNEMFATAFFFNHRKAGKDHLFLVANGHSVNEMERCTLKFHSRKRGGPDLGNTVELKVDDFWKSWHNHPNDLDIAVMPVSPLHELLMEKGAKVYIQSISSDLIPSKRELAEEIQPLEDVYFIGYPNDIYDKVNYLPVARKGTTATPLTVDFEGNPWFLLDGAIFPGSSGSPVMMIDQNGYIDRHNRFVPVRRVFFLGILRSAYTYIDERDRRKSKPKVVYRQMMDLGVIMRSSALRETIDDYLKDSETLSLRSRLTSRIRDRLGLNLLPLPLIK